MTLLDVWAVVRKHAYGIELLDNRMEILGVFSTETRANEHVSELPDGATTTVVPLKALPPDAEGRSILVEIVGGGPYRLAGGFYRSSGNEDAQNLSTKT